MTITRCLLHATAVAADGRAALIMGTSGAGKSDLALRVITTPFVDSGRMVPVSLVADDQVLIELADGRLLAAAPPAIAGRLEVRGVGILPVGHTDHAEVVLIVRLQSADKIERMPDPPGRHTILGVSLPVVEIDPHEPAASHKLVLALLRLGC